MDKKTELERLKAFVVAKRNLEVALNENITLGEFVSYLTFCCKFNQLSGHTKSLERDYV